MRILVLWDDNDFFDWSYTYYNSSNFKGKKHDILQYNLKLKDYSYDEAALEVNNYLQKEQKQAGKIDIIIGPTSSELVPRLLKLPEVLNNKIPLVTTNATSSLLSELSTKYNYHQMGVNNQHRVEELLNAIIRLYNHKDLNLYIFTKTDTHFVDVKSENSINNSLKQEESNVLNIKNTDKEKRGDKKEIENILLDKSSNEDSFVNYSYSRNLRDEIIKQFINAKTNNAFRKNLFHDISFTTHQEVIEIPLSEERNRKKKKKIVTHVEIINDLPLDRSYPIIICAESLDTVALVKHLRDRGNKNLIFAFGNNDKMRKHIMEGSYFVTDKASNPNERDNSAKKNSTVAKSLTNELINYLNSCDNLEKLEAWVNKKKETSKILKENLSVLGMEMKGQGEKRKELLFSEIGDLDKEKVKKEKNEKETEDNYILLTIKELRESNATNKKSLERLNKTIQELQESKETNKKSLDTAIRSIKLSKLYFVLSFLISLIVLVVSILTLAKSYETNQNDKINKNEKKTSKVNDGSLK